MSHFLVTKCETKDSIRLLARGFPSPNSIELSYGFYRRFHNQIPSEHLSLSILPDRNLQGTQHITTMMISEAELVLFPVLLIIFAVNCFEEGCVRFKGKTNVTIDTDQCLWEIYTDPRSKKFCLETCFKNKKVKIINKRIVRAQCNNTVILSLKVKAQITDEIPVILKLYSVMVR